MSSNQVSFFRAVQAVLWSFIGLRKNSEGQEDMAKLNPFHVLVVGLCLALIFVVGLNEMYVTDMDRRTEAAKLFLKKLGDTPYLWVGPANFTTDHGINKIEGMGYEINKMKVHILK